MTEIHEHDAIVIGAGLAGLAAALKLQAAGVDALALELQRRGQSREAGADDDRAMFMNLGQASAPAAPQSAGLGLPGRPDRQQSAGQKS